MAIVKILFNEFQPVRSLVFDELRPGAPKTANTEDKVTKVHNAQDS